MAGSPFGRQKADGRPVDKIDCELFAAGPLHGVPGHGVEPGASDKAEQEVKKHAKAVGCLAALCALACIKPRNHLEKVSRALGVAATVACLAETWVGRKFKDLSRANGPPTACLRSEASKGQHVETRAIEPINDL